MMKIPYSKKTLEGKKLWRIWRITTICQVFFANFPLIFCNMRHAHQREVRFNLFYARIEVMISILQCLRGPVHFQAIVCLYIHSNPQIIDSTVLLAIIKQHATSTWYKTNPRKYGVCFYVHQYLELHCSALFYC